MLKVCGDPECQALTFGDLCISHEPPVEPRHFPRGRPYRLKDREVPAAERRIDQSWPLAEQVQLQSSSPS